MRIDAVVEIPYARARVFEVYRDRLPELVPYLPNVRGIERVRRVDEGHVTRLLNRWKGGGEIPPVARRFVSERFLEWDDHATWDASAFTTAWRTEVPALGEAVRAAGMNRYEELGPALTRVHVGGEVLVDPAHVPGLPRLVGSGLGPLVEKFLVAAITPNLVEVSRGVERWLREHDATEG